MLFRSSFVLEQGISIDSGTITNVSASNIGFNRTAYVGLAGAFGEVRLGRMLTAYDALRGSTNHLYDSSGFASTLQVWSAGATAAKGIPAVTGSDYLARGNNTVLYATPLIGPFSGSVSVSAGEGVTTDIASPRMVTGHVKYAAGPIRFGYSYQGEKYATGYNKFHLIAGNYDLKLVRFVGAFQRQIDERVPGGQTSQEWEVGMDVPLDLATVAIGYAKAVTRNAADVEVVNARGLSLMGTYNLSKRTRLYTALRQIIADRADGSRSMEVTRWGVGVSHNF